MRAAPESWSKYTTNIVGPTQNGLAYQMQDVVLVDVFKTRTNLPDVTLALGLIQDKVGAKKQKKIVIATEARWSIGRPSASHSDHCPVWGSNPGKGNNLYMLSLRSLLF